MFKFILADTGVKPRPRPHQATLGMHISNAFQILGNVHERDDKHAQGFSAGNNFSFGQSDNKGFPNVLGKCNGKLQKLAIGQVH